MTPLSDVEYTFEGVKVKGQGEGVKVRRKGKAKETWRVTRVLNADSGMLVCFAVSCM